METYDLSMHSGSNVADFSYVEQMRYFQYLQEQMVQENELNAYVSECLCLSEGTSIKELSALNEAISDKASNAWNKILDFLRRMWGKFTHTFGNLFNSNREYLSKYKDIILNKPIKAFQDVNMNDCEEAIKRMFEVKLSPIDNARLERLPENDKETTGAGNKLDKFRTTIVQDWKDGNPTNNRDQKEFVGWLSDYFKATDKQLRNKPASSFNMKDLYDFCYDGAENGPLYKQIERERKLIESDASQFEKELKELKVDKAPGAGVIKNTVPKADATPPGKADAKPPVSTAPEGADHGSAVMFSRVYNTYISEADLNKSSDASSETKSQEDNSNTAERAYTNRNDATEKQLDDKNREGRVKDAAAQKETIEFKAKTYITLATNVCTAKLNGLSFVYGEYMQIIKAHVSSYVGNENKGETRATQTGTNYNQQAGNQQQNNQQQVQQNSATLDGQYPLNEGWGAWFSWLFSPYGLGKPLVYDNISRSNFEKIQNKPELVKAINKLTEPVVREAKRGNKNLSEKAPFGISDFRKNWTPLSMLDYLFKGTQKGVFNDKNYKYDMFFLFDTEEIIGVYVILYDTERNVPVKFTVPVPSKKQYSQYA